MAVRSNWVTSHYRTRRIIARNSLANWVCNYLFPFPYTEDPCEPNEHDSIDDIWRSAGHNSTGRAEAELLDDQGLAEGWYRFVSEAGGEMPTACVPVNSCGTRFPVWMDGTVPTVNQTQDVTGCINQGGTVHMSSQSVNASNVRGSF